MQYVCLSNKHLVLASKLCLCTFYTCSWFGPSVVWTHAPFLSSFWFSSDELRCKPTLLTNFKKNPKQITSSFLVLSLHRQFIMFSYFAVLEACLNTNSQGPPATRHGSTSVIMRCLGLQEPTCVHVYTRACACHSWHSTPAGSVIVCSLGRIALLNCSGGSRNALIYTVLRL